MSNDQSDRDTIPPVTACSGSLRLPLVIDNWDLAIPAEGERSSRIMRADARGGPPFFDTIEEVRIPITEQSLAGFCAKYLRPVNIADAYNIAELQGIHPALNHDTSYDKRTGFKTKQVLTYPIVAENKYLMGVLQLLNKKSGGRFTRKDEESVAEIATALGISFFNLKKLTTKKATTKFDMLVMNGKISQQDLDAAIAESRKSISSDLESILIEKYKVPKVEIGKSIAQFHKCPYIEYSERTLVDIELLRNLNVDYLKKNHWMPLKRDRTAIEILTDDPGDLDRVADIKRTFPGLNIRFAVSLRRDISQFLSSATGGADRKDIRLRRDVKRAPIRAAKAKIHHRPGGNNAADQPAVGQEDPNAVG